MVLIRCRKGLSSLDLWVRGFTGPNRSINSESSHCRLLLCDNTIFQEIHRQPIAMSFSAWLRCLGTMLPESDFTDTCLNILLLTTLDLSAHLSVHFVLPFNYQVSYKLCWLLIHTVCTWSKRMFSNFTRFPVRTEFLQLLGGKTVFLEVQCSRRRQYFTTRDCGAYTAYYEENENN